MPDYPVPPMMDQGTPQDIDRAAMEKRRAEEAALAKVQDAALAAVKAACDAERARLVEHTKQASDVYA
jgi:hypothetical protein